MTFLSISQNYIVSIIGFFYDPDCTLYIFDALAAASKVNSARLLVLSTRVRHELPCVLANSAIRLEYQYPVHRLSTGMFLPSNLPFFLYLFFGGSANVEIFRNRRFSSHSSNCSLWGLAMSHITEVALR